MSNSAATRTYDGAVPVFNEGKPPAVVPVREGGQLPYPESPDSSRTGKRDGRRDAATDEEGAS